MNAHAEMSRKAGIPEFGQIMGHPGPLWMLFMSEFWERFAFYGIRWALVLYIVAQFHGGSATGQAPASSIYGAYLALVYAAAFFGGYFADKVLGYQRSILVGAVFMATGLFLISLPDPQIFKLGLATIYHMHLERATTHAADGDQLLLRLVEAVRERGRGRLVDDPQHVQPGDLTGFLGGLALRVVEVRRHGDHRTEQLAIERILGALPQGGQYLCRHLHRGLEALWRAHLNHARAVDQLVRQAPGVVQVSEPASHQPFDRGNGVLRIDALHRLGCHADIAAPVGAIVHDRRQQHSALFIGKAFRVTVAHRGHQRMRGAQVDAHSDPTRVRIGALTRLRQLQQRHRVTCPPTWRPMVLHQALASPQ
jgi:hypothetical protein